MDSVLQIEGRQWAVKLSGDAIDLQASIELLGAGNQLVRSHVLPAEPDAIVLQADEFELLQESIEVYNTAERIIVALNAVLYLEDPDRKPIAISSVHQRDENGRWSITIFPRSISIRIRGAAARGLAGSLGIPTPPTPQSHWVQTALDTEAVADVLSYLRETPDWISLYKAYEALDKEIDLKSQPIAGWPSRSRISAFTRTAQLHRHSKAWNDKHGITSQGAIGFDEASTLVRNMIRTWLEWRREHPPN